MTPVDPIKDSLEPTKDCIRFQGGFKYQLVQDAVWKVKGLTVAEPIETKFVCLFTDGTLLLRAGFAWNGVSGPTIQRNSNRRGGAFHDGFYRLIRFGLLDLPRETARAIADEMLREIWIKDGMWKWLVSAEIAVLKKFGEDSAKPSGEPTVMTSP